MKERFSVLHVGNVLLGNPYTGLTATKCKECYRRFPEVFDALFEYIRSESIDLVLFSGNLCGRYLTSDDAKHLISILASLPECRFVISPGEQDPYAPDSLYASGRMPSNVHIFENESLERIDFEDLGASVYGWAIHGQRTSFTPLSGSHVVDSTAVNFISGSCVIGTRPLSAHVTAEEIADFGADYAAFAHGQATPLRTAGTTQYCHMGFLEGRSFEEAGHGGFHRIDVLRRGEEKQLDVSFVPLSRHHYETVTIDITGVAGMSDVMRRVRAVAEERGYGHNTSLRVILEGELEPTVLLRHTLEETHTVELYSLDFIDHTLPTLDTEQLERDMTVRGELYRMLKKRFSSGTLEDRIAVAQALRAGLAALESRDITMI
jgi:hypothetical protein